ncbi:MAG: hypothetical protein WC026_13190 [Hyphomicrobium sp.]|uniref:hypothetical protein n=1 Tax=Hyphomicrobium sp. TaxID=82 RepID=UPI003567EE1E
MNTRLINTESYYFLIDLDSEIETENIYYNDWCNGVFYNQYPRKAPLEFYSNANFPPHSIEKGKNFKVIAHLPIEKLEQQKYSLFKLTPAFLNIILKLPPIPVCGNMEQEMLKQIFIKTGGRKENPEIARICSEITVKNSDKKWTDKDLERVISHTLYIYNNRSGSITTKDVQKEIIEGLCSENTTKEPIGFEIEMELIGSPSLSTPKVINGVLQGTYKF